MKRDTLEEVTTDLVIEAVRRRWGYDLSTYARASLTRRIALTCQQCHADDVFSLLPRLVKERGIFDSLINNLSVTVTEMFRDPEVFVALRENVIPQLATYPFIRVWHAGCATGEEMYALAILFDEAGLLEKTQFHGTDINKGSLLIAEEGIYPLERLQGYARSYRKAGGKNSFADYFHAAYDSARMDERLRIQMSFAHHDLSGDEAFGEFHLILCRNVLIYFGHDLQVKVLDVFKRSLVPFGYLCLGLQEYLAAPQGWQDIERRLNIYKRAVR
ncbi:TPA: protein-glutamate O-methyltransferase CheR [Vibrio cholerae]|jgi:chemotaxis protein methyltransferase CheR